MKNTRKILFSAALLSSGLTMAQTTTAEKSPNVIYIMADDLGIGDLGCYGQRQIKTPNIDGIAQNGMKFMQHYSGSTVSAPSRCALITGKHMGHAAIRGNAKVAGSDGLLYETPLPAGEVTVADIFKTKNYVTGCVGKWGMGGPGTEGMPGKHGFDYFYGYLGQRFAHSYYPEFLHENEQKIMLDGKYYSHDLMLEKALNFIDENAQKPFFLYFSPTIPHADLDIMGEAMTEYEGEFCETPFGGSRDGYKSQQNPRAAYAAMVTYLDKSVGLIIKELKEKGLYDHTIIVFTSDNGVHSEGGHDPSYFDSNGPFRGQKRDLYEGGIRTPFVIQWPGVIPQGVVTNHISAFWDFLPTIGELVQADIPQNIDGISYLPTLTGKGTQKEHDCIYYEFFEFGGKQSIMTPDGWKLVRLEVSDSSKTYEELYEQFLEYYDIVIDCLVTTNNIQHDVWRKHNMSLVNSFLKPDCLAKGQHIGNMGYRYNATYNIEDTGTINMVNSLYNIKKLVFEDKKYTLEELTDALINNFGFKNADEIGSFSLEAQEKRDDDDGRYDQIHADCLRSFKYGNDIPEVDGILAEFEDWYCGCGDKYESLYAKPFYVCQMSVSTHAPQGAATLASADGRLSGTTFADASMSAYPGTDRNGAYALFESATCWDHSRSQNSQMNLKLHPNAVKGIEGSKKLLDLTRSYMRKGGFHIQFNIVDSKVLKDAQKHPNNYRDLLVRVAGFTQYWVEIGKPIQDEVVARTEYEGV